MTGRAIFKGYGRVPEKTPRMGVAMLLLMAALQFSYGQDVHFTQFFTNPLILNAAHTGYYDGDYRAGFNFKAQWPWAISNQVYNYHTETPYIDFAFGEKKIKVGWMGLGFKFLNDQAGDGGLTYRRIGLSYAYHQAFDKAHRYILSAGVGVDYIIRSVDFSKFYFNNQWVEEQGFNLTANNNEPLERQSFSMPDVNAGIKFEGRLHEQVKLDAGFSMMHLNRPKHTFFNNSERLGFRYQANAGAECNINARNTVQLHFYYGNEKKASEIVVGAMYGMGFYTGRRQSVDHTLYFGAYYRIKDALAPLFGYQFKKTRLLLSYDVTLSKLVGPARANGGPEISLVHIGSWKRNYNGNKVYCPSFAR